MRGQKIEQIERPQSLSDIAAEAIRDAIITGQYALGEALSENSLTEALGTSKTPIREALALLKHEGLVTVVPQKGTFVFTMSVDEVAQLASYRFALESQAIGYSMARDQDALVSSLLTVSTITHCSRIVATSIWRMATRLLRARLQRYEHISLDIRHIPISPCVNTSKWRNYLKPVT